MFSVQNFKEEGMDDVQERLNDLDQARHRDLRDINARFERVEGDVSDIKASKKAHSDRLDSGRLALVESISELKIMLARQGTRQNLVLGALTIIGVTVVGEIVRGWF